jgi:hypothetical protein
MIGEKSAPRDFHGRTRKTSLEVDPAGFSGPAPLRKVDETPDKALWERRAREHRHFGSKITIGSEIEYSINLGDGPVGVMFFLSFGNMNETQRLRVIGSE